MESVSSATFEEARHPRAKAQVLVRFLLDTHTFLWFLLEALQLSTIASNLIIDPTNDIEVSPATYWEIAIKISLGNR